MMAAAAGEQGGPTPAQREAELAVLRAQLGGTRQAALAYWCRNRLGLSEAERLRHQPAAGTPVPSPPRRPPIGLPAWQP